jgi:hypothetical protein
LTSDNGVYRQEWCCTQCGGAGVTEVDSDMSPLFRLRLLVRAHSLQCPGCDGDAVESLILRRPGSSDRDWERTKKRIKELAAYADHSETWMSWCQWLRWPW